MRLRLANIHSNLIIAPAPACFCLLLCLLARAWFPLAAWLRGRDSQSVLLKSFWRLTAPRPLPCSVARVHKHDRLCHSPFSNRLEAHGGRGSCALQRCSTRRRRHRHGQGNASPLTPVAHKSDSRTWGASTRMLAADRGRLWARAARAPISRTFPHSPRLLYLPSKRNTVTALRSYFQFKWVLAAS
jgi:hypothetical protein